MSELRVLTLELCVQFYVPSDKELGERFKTRGYSVLKMKNGTSRNRIKYREKVFQSLSQYARS